MTAAGRRSDPPQTIRRPLARMADLIRPHDTEARVCHANSKRLAALDASAGPKQWRHSARVPGIFKFPNLAQSRPSASSSKNAAHPTSLSSRVKCREGEVQSGSWPSRPAVCRLACAMRHHPPYPGIFNTAASEILVSHTTFSGSIINQGVIGTGGIVVIDSTFHGGYEYRHGTRRHPRRQRQSDPRRRRHRHRGAEHRNLRRRHHQCGDAVRNARHCS